MENLPVMEWLYRPTPEKLKQIEQIKKILQWVIYLSGPVYVYVIYQNFLYNKQAVEPMVYLFSAIYLSSIVVWNLFLSKAIEFRPKIYRLSNENLEIIDYQSDKSKIFNWDELVNFYNLKEILLPGIKNRDESTVIYTIIRKGGEKQAHRNNRQYQIRLYAYKENASKVKEFLKAKIRKNEQ